jgi:hypothetical protein
LRPRAVNCETMITDQLFLETEVGG